MSLGSATGKQGAQVCLRKEAVLGKSISTVNLLQEKAG